MQPCAPSTLVSRALHRLLGSRVASYTYVDFCAGAGGPTPSIEKALNAQLQSKGSNASSNGTSSSLAEVEMNARVKFARGANGSAAGGDGGSGVDFVLTDIAPHPTAWSKAAEHSERLHYVPSPIDASAAPENLLSDLTTLSPLADGLTQARLSSRPPFRLFFLAFHHFPDPLARAILRDTFRHSHGFGIFELQDRSVGGILTVLTLGPLMWLTTWLYFWRDPVMLFWTYVVPVVPFVIVFDGVVSCLRTRTGEEIGMLVRECGADTEGWRLRDGTELHTRTGGRMTWYAGVRE